MREDVVKLLKILLAFVVASFVLGTFVMPANAASWPNRPIHLIVPYPPGGGTDLLARVLGAQLEKSLGQAIVIDNRPGGSTVIGSDALANAAPDGYTVGMVFDSLAINSVLGVRTSYNPEKDFEPIIKLAEVPLVLTVNAQQVPMKTLPELVAYSKAHPGWFTFGSLGPGSPHEIGFLWFNAMSKMQALLVPYKGIAPALQDVVAGQVRGMFVGVSVADEHIRQGTLRALGVTSPQRLVSSPDVPTIAEQGYPEYDFVTFYGLAAPKGTPPEIVDRLNKEINRIFQMPDVRERIEKTGAVLVGGTQQEFGNFLTANFVKFKKIMALTGDKPK
jgi:tripartite-type tricarboxylate transporter receptor subunit TctC